MAIGIPQNFQAISNILPSYNFTDIVSGTGIINFYAGHTIDINLMSNTPFYSDTVYKQSGYPDNLNVYESKLDVDFDCILNRPLVIKGKTVVNIPIYVQNGTSNPGYFYVVLNVCKWDGVTETVLATNTSSIVYSSDGTGTYLMTATDLDIPLTTFKVGEYLRLNVVGWLKATGNSNSTTFGRVGDDPMNRSSNWDTTGAVPSKLVFQVPVRLNL